MNDTPATILNADDDETGRHTRTDILQNAGFTVIEAATGREALEKVKSMPDLVLLDVNLPDINGFEVCRRIREDETTAQIPVLYISATSMDDDALVIGPEGGADGYLIRPVYPQVLISTIRSLLRIRAAESAFLESEERYRMLFEGMSSGVAVYRPVDDGMDFVFVDFNSSGERIDHIDRDKIIGKRVTEVFPGIGEFGLLDILRRVSRTGNPERYPISKYHDNNLSGWRDNYVYRLPSGEIVAIYDDITEQKKAEDALRESNEFLNNLLDYASAPIIIWNPELQITRFNHALERLTGRSEQEVLGKHIELLFPPENREASLEKIQKTFAGEQLESVEIPILHISGNVRIILWNSTNILAHDGRIISTMARGRTSPNESVRKMRSGLPRHFSTLSLI